MQTSGLPLHEWLVLLETYSPEEIDLGLDRVETLLRRMDLPQLDCVLHVAVIINPFPMMLTYILVIRLVKGG